MGQLMLGKHCLLVPQDPVTCSRKLGPGKHLVSTATATSGLVTVALRGAGVGGTNKSHKQLLHLCEHAWRLRESEDRIHGAGES